jgi:hypothetical protein
MGFPINGDLVPSTSGFSNLGVDVSSNGRNAFDITSIRPFNHVHQVSGVFHDTTLGQSGVLRYSRAAAAFQVSVDGGKTFQDLAAGAGVDSVGVMGGADLTGNVDIASHGSGFISVTDTAGASPIVIGVDQLGLSGMWDFPTQGFNGSVVNELTDFNGTTAQGAISVVGASGIIVDIVGQTMTIASNTDVGSVARCYSETFGAATSWVVTHSLNTTNVSVSIYNSDSPALAIMPDEVEITDADNVTIGFNVAQAGDVIIMGH